MWILYTLVAVSAFAILSVIDSLLVHNFEDRPFVITWVQSMMSVPMILIAGLLFPTENSWVALLMLTGVVAYIGDILFWRIIKIVDVSATYFIGGFIAIIMVTVGVTYFHETVSVSLLGGALLILSGVAFLSFSKHGSLNPEALILMFFASLFFAPFYLVQKWMLDHGETFFSTFYWMMLGRELSAVVLSSGHPRIRRQILSSMPKQPLRFFFFNLCSIALFLFAMATMSLAYRVGHASLVSLLANIQPFVVISFAALVAYAAPRHAPKELFTAPSLRTKTISFSFVFIGLALLGVST